VVKEVKKMTVHVVVEMFQGVVNDVKVFFSEESAWLAGHDITNDMDREGKAHNGTELLIFECKVEA